MDILKQILNKLIRKRLDTTKAAETSDNKQTVVFSENVAKFINDTKDKIIK